MPTKYELSPRELQMVMDYITDGKRDILLTDIPKRFNAVHAAFVSRLTAECNAASEKIFRLERRLDSEKVKKDKEIASGIFAEAGLDSAEIAQALLYRLQQLKTYRLTKGKVIIILYEMYSSWLASKKERLTIEHPVATEFGPQFWRAYSRLDVKIQMNSAALDSIRQQNPGVAVFIDNAARKYYDYHEEDLKKTAMKSAAYLNATAEHNNGKWNKEISDSDIFNSRNK